jgi:hypothetical protein
VEVAAVTMVEEAAAVTVAVEVETVAVVMTGVILTVTETVIKKG